MQSFLSVSRYVCSISKLLLYLKFHIRVTHRKWNPCKNSWIKSETAE